MSLLAGVGAPLPVEARRYDSHRAGHPLRIAGYIGHSVGWLLDVLIFRPAWYVGQIEPIATIVGMEHNREDPDSSDAPLRPEPDSDRP